MNIIAFAFRGNISSKILKKLNIKKKYVVSSNKKAINNLVRKLIEENPSYILGLGMYNRVDKDKLRIETHYSKDRNKFPINYFLTPSKSTKFANGIGNSYCNFISLQIMKAIKNKQLNSKYAFIHIPKTFQINEAVSEIESMLATLGVKLPNKVY